MHVAPVNMSQQCSSRCDCLPRECINCSPCKLCSANGLNDNALAKLGNQLHVAHHTQRENDPQSTYDGSPLLEAALAAAPVPWLLLPSSAPAQPWLQHHLGTAACQLAAAAAVVALMVLLLAADQEALLQAMASRTGAVQLQLPQKATVEKQVAGGLAAVAADQFLLHRCCFSTALVAWVAAAASHTLLQLVCGSYKPCPHPVPSPAGNQAQQDNVRCYCGDRTVEQQLLGGCSVWHKVCCQNSTHAFTTVGQSLLVLTPHLVHN
jgi:hypothetical protein